MQGWMALDPKAERNDCPSSVSFLGWGVQWNRGMVHPPASRGPSQHQPETSELGGGGPMRSHVLIFFFLFFFFPIFKKRQKSGVFCEIS